ncbi:MAG: hypothetical protein U0842_22280 [Candidatus Binatia bacterium]
MRPDPASVAARVAALLLVGATLALLVVARPALSPRDTIVLRVHARERIGRLDPIWDETNLWKLYLQFGVQQPDPADANGERWIARRAPWLGWGRVNAVLGGNHAAAIAPWCDHGTSSDAHPEVVPGECGADGVPGAAARNELVRGDRAARTVDYAPLRTAVERLLRSGVAPHLNVSAAPAAFTGGATDFFAYHWNGAPVTDLDAWSAFVRGAFATLADLGTNGWRASIVNEPNCLTLVGRERHVRHVGYAGTPEDYARTFVAAARAIRSVAPGIAIHAGNFVTSVTFDGEDNLPDYLRALAHELAASPDFGWQDVRAISTSLYETPDTSLYEFVPLRLARLEAAERAAGLAPKPVKIDELEIHERARGGYADAEEQPMDTTLFAASWHAEAMRAFVVSGRVVSSADWLAHSFDTRHALAPYPKARVYELLGVLAGQLDAGTSDDGTAAFAPSGRTRGWTRVAVTGGRTWDAARAARFGRATTSGAARRTVRSLDALATRSRDAVRVLVVHHQNDMVADASPRAVALARDVELAFDGLGSGAWQARALAVGGEDGVRWDGRTTPAPRWRDLGCTCAVAGRVTLPPRRMPANAVWLVELRREPLSPCAEPAPAPARAP